MVALFDPPEPETSNKWIGERMIRAEINIHFCDCGHVWENIHICGKIICMCHWWSCPSCGSRKWRYATYDVPMEWAREKIGKGDALHSNGLDRPGGSFSGTSFYTAVGQLKGESK